MSGISTHILDTGLGRPAAGVPVVLDRADGEHWRSCASTLTDSDGRCAGLVAAEKVRAGRYRLTFATSAYFAGKGVVAVYPEVTITFDVAADGESYHMPLLLNRFGYTTYRGS